MFSNDKRARVQRIYTHYYDVSQLSEPLVFARLRLRAGRFSFLPLSRLNLDLSPVFRRHRTTGRFVYLRAMPFFPAYVYIYILFSGGVSIILLFFFRSTFNSPLCISPFFPALSWRELRSFFFFLEQRVSDVAIISYSGFKKLLSIPRLLSLALYNPLRCAARFPFFPHIPASSITIYFCAVGI